MAGFTGEPDLAAEIAEVAKPDWIGLDRDQWGLDHGTWSVLAHVYPEADVPVLQLSINALRPLEYHLALGRRLAPLRERGILVIASGKVVRNLGRLQWSKPDLAYDWSERFDDAVADQIARDPGDILAVTEHPHYALAVHTPEHFAPLLFLAGLAAEGGERVEPLVRGHSMGSISMACYGLGADIALRSVPACAARMPPHVPTLQSNI